MDNIALAGYLKKQIQKYEGGVDLESNKNVSITSNGTTVVKPSTGKDGMEQVTVNVNVSGGGGGGLPDTVYFYGVTGSDSGYAGYCSMISSEEITGVGTYDVYFNSNAVEYQLAGAEATEKISITIDEVIEGSCGYSLGRFTYNNSVYYLCLGKE